MSSPSRAGRCIAGSAKLFVREQVRTDVSENVPDDLSKNLDRFRADMRANVVVTRPAGFVEVDLTGNS